MYGGIWTGRGHGRWASPGIFWMPLNRAVDTAAVNAMDAIAPRYSAGDIDAFDLDGVASDRDNGPPRTLVASVDWPLRTLFASVDGPPRTLFAYVVEGVAGAIHIVGGR